MGFFAYVAVGVAVVLTLLARIRPRRSLWVAAGGWLTYALYEALMAARVLCSGECNIRIDLLLIWPILLLMTLVALVKAMRVRKSDRRD